MGERVERVSASSSPARAPVPVGFGIELDPETVVLPGGRALLGGDPVRLLKLSEAGARAFEELSRGPVRTPAAGALARRLLATGTAHPRPPAGATCPRVSVVVPVRDRPAELDRLLGAVAETSTEAAEVIVVDDGSRDPVPVAATAARHGARLVLRDTCAGPAAARNAGLAACADTEVVAFVDSDCVPPPGWLTRLGAHFSDPAVAAVAPRIRPLAGGRSLLARYAGARSPLDLDHREAPVRPGTRVGYVPTAVLLVRRAALTAAFDEALRYGEDVDAVWRMIDSGWQVRYAPSVQVAHEEPATWSQYLRRRYRYGTSAGPLARRHPERLAPVVLRPWSAAVAALLLVGRPGAAGAVAAFSAVRMSSALRGSGVTAPLAAKMTVRPVGSTLVGLGRYAAQLTLPAALAAALVPPGRRGRRLAALGGLLAAPALRDWFASRPGVDPVRWTLACLVDDAAYGAGVWRGALRSRTLRPLLPRMAGEREAGSSAAGTVLRHWRRTVPGYGPRPSR
ncbi:mycofactocin system glycosyltransferase [Lipingzhangella halophila]|uniref:Mycofactocin system glycosyltransferase n=1 Tax=Lipingzhangella halophila TaxID=1783352 RepID=A0A7W7RFS2_9ACTN|nr:mycofactocin biosynthesis glycosyltransferase MftF [Lipingzhangella halophila]MBB4931203.1 mycofactocin system glycosyltransferase [Lipingzhangella halophila]